MTTFTRTTNDPAAWLDGIAAEIAAFRVTYEGAPCDELLEEAQKQVMDASRHNRFKTELAVRGKESRRVQLQRLGAEASARARDEYNLYFSLYPADYAGVSIVTLLYAQDAAALFYEGARRGAGIDV